MNSTHFIRKYYSQITDRNLRLKKAVTWHSSYSNIWIQDSKPLTEKNNTKDYKVFKETGNLLQVLNFKENKS